MSGKASFQKSMNIWTSYYFGYKNIPLLLLIITTAFSFAFCLFSFPTSTSTMW